MSGMCLLSAHATHYPRTPPCKARKKHPNADRQSEWRHPKALGGNVDCFICTASCLADSRMDLPLSQRAVDACCFNPCLSEGVDLVLHERDEW